MVHRWPKHRYAVHECTSYETEVMDCTINCWIKWIVWCRNFSDVHCRFWCYGFVVDHAMKVEHNIQSCFILRPHLVTVFIDLEQACDAIWQNGILGTFHECSLRVCALRLQLLACLCQQCTVLTLRLLMSYIYGAPSKARNANIVYIWTYVWQRWNSLFLFAAQCFNIESMQRGFLCHICV